jgi:hypothetical protein
MAIRKLAPAVSVAALILITACGQEEAQAPAVEAPVAEAVVVEEAPGLPKTASAPGASVFFITPEDGATVSNPVTIEFGIEGMTVVAAGVNDAHSGHHHLLVDTGLPALDLPVPADPNHIHFGDGSTSTELTLDPGEHTLQLLLADHLHIPHEPPVTSATITITVE